MKTATKRRRAVPGIDPEAFVRAAERLDDHTECFACNALWLGTGRPRAEMYGCWYRERDDLPEVHYFTALFKPRMLWDNIPTWYAYRQDDEMPCDDLRQARILGLLLAAELAREGFVPDGYEPIQPSP